MHFFGDLVMESSEYLAVNANSGPLSERHPDSRSAVNVEILLFTFVDILTFQVNSAEL